MEWKRKVGMRGEMKKKQNKRQNKIKKKITHSSSCWVNTVRREKKRREKISQNYIKLVRLPIMKMKAINLKFAKCNEP